MKASGSLHHKVVACELLSSTVSSVCTWMKTTGQRQSWGKWATESDSTESKFQAFQDCQQDLRHPSSCFQLQFPLKVALVRIKHILLVEEGYPKSAPIAQRSLNLRKG